MLYIVATPIGNLEDITLRALRILKEVNLILCEDTRVTQKLLNHYNIKKPLVSYHEHSRLKKNEFIIKELKDGKNLALVTDAGTPGISDPGNKLIEEVLKEEIKIVPIPGPSALGIIISVAGINLKEFLFLGFPPHKKGRETFFKKIASQDLPVIYFESSHRIIKNLELLKSFDEKLNVIVGKELTKMFEEIIRGKIGEAVEYLQKNPEKTKGEFTIIIYK